MVYGEKTAIIPHPRAPGHVPQCLHLGQHSQQDGFCPPAFSMGHDRAGGTICSICESQAAQAAIHFISFRDCSFLLAPTTKQNFVFFRNPFTSICANLFLYQLARAKGLPFRALSATLDVRGRCN